MCMLERATCTPGEGLAQVLGCHKTPVLVLLPLHYLQMYKNTKNYIAGSAAFFPGEVIILWADCMSLYSGRSFLNMGLTKHFFYSTMGQCLFTKTPDHVSSVVLVAVQPNHQCVSSLSTFFFHLYVAPKTSHKINSY